MSVSSIANTVPGSTLSSVLNWHPISCVFLSRSQHSQNRFCDHDQEKVVTEDDDDDDDNTKISALCIKDPHHLVNLVLNSLCDHVSMCEYHTLLKKKNGTWHIFP